MSTVEQTDLATTESIAAEAGALGERLFGSLLGTLELFAMYVGVKLGLYLRLTAPLTSVELADQAGIHPRYAREWLEQQAAAGIVAVDDVTLGPDERRYWLSPGHREALTDEDSPYYATPMVVLAGGAGNLNAEVIEAYRRGTGISFGGYGDDIRHGQGSFNRAAFRYQLVDEWLPAMPGVGDRLAQPGARVVDVGCGVGWSSIALAQAFAGIRVDGVDSDEASISDARQNAEDAGVADRVTFLVADADNPLEQRYDVAFIFEALHDMAHPVAVLTAIRGALLPGASLVVMDERAAEQFTAPADEIERVLYAFSVLHCLPVGMSQPDSVGTGTLMRPDVLHGYSQAAGFTTMDILPIEHEVFRFYQLSG